MGDVTNIRTTEKKVETWLAALTAHESVTRMQAASGQVLIHRDHVPSGVFVVLSGELALSTSLDAADAWAVTADRPYLLPHPAELDLPAGCAARVRTNVELLHVPRSLMWLAPEIGYLLQHAPLPAVSLSSHAPVVANPAGQSQMLSIMRSTKTSGTKIPVSPKAAQSPTRSSPTDSTRLSSK